MNPGKQVHLVNSGVYIGALIGGKLGGSSTPPYYFWLVRQTNSTKIQKQSVLLLSFMKLRSPIHVGVKNMGRVELSQLCR
ncbi:putative P6 protein [Cherry-associated luteovirus]|nr:putative P6 protein [Cherry-associated luteovirus]APA23021.1 putative P6 protein [Cherry-associated luteovirus]